MAVSNVQPLKDPPLVSSTVGATYSTYTGNGTNGQTNQIYDVYTYTGSGSITLNNGGFADVLVVAGGGGGARGADHER